ncbi:GNAT family N-acetyltransferase [Mariniflexile sp. AS56]|uniref:GNAT family N-acetyltransferase n=1 Tax=Mariniflexile sp. AS56 TaxID=3063957 RepID=UPI0026F37324|nr:GNAT family N-acetyltransferase [Mariniflexile sp. AS56]MDO7172682.1 GNAT family N-acetyltransferase [Mariniflexile sp. AS56]
MTIKTFDAFSKPSFIDINRITNFLFENSSEARDTKSAIRKSILYAAKEIPGLGGYVFVMEHNNSILGAVVINKTGMNEYIPENILVYIAVKKEFREKGIGKALVKHTITYCNGDISTHVNKDNPVVKLFEKQGFKSRNIELRLVRE